MAFFIPRFLKLQESMTVKDDHCGSGGGINKKKEEEKEQKKG